MTGASKPKVYRLRNIPAHADRLAVTQLVTTALNDPYITAGDVQISSLAPAVELWKRWRTQVATLTFKQVPKLLASQSLKPGEPEPTFWSLAVPGLPEPLVLDTQFDGLTPLNETSLENHEYDCIAISGLASHPFGSWQPKGDDKSFMWIRDTLPQSLPNIRFLLYGYDTSIVNSKSFQTVADIAGALLSSLQANIWAETATKPLMFLAHSLGGVILKKLLIMLANGTDRLRSMLQLVKGAIFFGTPSVGMPISHLLSIVENQPNKALIEALSDHSPFLSHLEVQFRGISLLQHMKLFWAYETRTSPTVEKDGDGVYKRTGPKSVMVDPKSAIGDSHAFNLLETIPIDEDHSNMVKFLRGHPAISVVVNKLKHICLVGESFIPNVPDVQHLLGQAEPETPIAPAENRRFLGAGHSSSSSPDENTQWDNELLLHAIQPPEWDSRLNQIDTNFGHSFHWAFENASVGLTEWLRKGTGLFWVSGKPGSGKSTFMKFLLNDPRTRELLHKWNSPSSQIIGNFFFHYRGTLLQKSFEGLLRSLVTQLPEEEPRLRPIMRDVILDSEFQLHLKRERLGTLHDDLHEFFHLHKIHPKCQGKLTAILAQDPMTVLNSLIQRLLPKLDVSERWAIKKIILDDFQKWPDILKVRDNRQRKKDILHRVKHTINNRLREPKRFSNAVEDLVEEWAASTNIVNLLENIFHKHPGRVFIGEGQDVGSLFSSGQRELQSETSVIHVLAQRQMNRHKARLEISQKPWSRSQLEKSLGLALSQAKFDLELFLVFDALDEYDGQHEVICDFLKDLATMPSKSKTRTKILFSSRPWPVFRKEFQSQPGFELHNYTQEDIREYCTGLLRADSIARTLILPLVGEIANRARGVFLWVKLVMRDMVQCANSATGDTSLQVRQRLDSLPDELDTYYSDIIGRLPSAIRQETYILLESLLRSNVPILRSEVRFLIRSSTVHTYQEFELDEASELEVDNYIRAISGGLVEVVPLNGSYTIQLLHQTCREWVAASAFKHIVLDDRASVTWENGHSYLTKFNSRMLLTWKTEEYCHHFMFHAQGSEMTTGVSQYEHLSSLPAEFYAALKACGIYMGYSGLALAACGRLELYLQEIINHDESACWHPRVSDVSLFAILLKQQIPLYFPARQKRTPEIEMGKVLLKHGYKLGQDHIGTAHLMSKIWEWADRQEPNPYLDLMINAATRNLLDPKDSSSADYFYKSVVFNGSRQPTSENGWLASQWQLLHFSPPALARCLLELGSAVNSVNSINQTPLDYVIHPDSLHSTRGFGNDCLYEMASLLAQAGGVVKATTAHDLDSLAKKFAGSGYDISPFENLFPKKNLITPTESIEPRIQESPRPLTPTESAEPQIHRRSRHRTRDRIKEFLKF